MQRRLEAEEWAAYARQLDAAGHAAWCELAGRYLAWATPPRIAATGDFAAGAVRWFADGMLDPTVSCLDRHLAGRAGDTALIAVGDDPDGIERWTFAQLHAAVCRAANTLAALGVRPGDAVGICLPTIPAAAVAMLACARLGAPHGVVFAGFGVDALAERWNDLGCRVVVTTDVVHRGGRTLPLKATVDAALARCPAVHAVLVVRREPGTSLVAGRDHDWDAALAAAAPTRPPAPGRGDRDLFVLHTSGSSGRPKGLVHGTAGFLLHAALTHQATTGYADGDRYACLADIGWITGHAYALYGPLANGAPVVLDEGTPLFPDARRYWRLVERLGLSVLFTVPTALRLIVAAGADTTGMDVSSLRLIACAGEILDPATVAWIATHLPGVRLVNIYGQTEGSGHLLAAQTGLVDSASPAVTPCLGIAAALVDTVGRDLVGAGSGRLVLRRPWPGLAHTMLGDHDRFVRTYLSAVPGAYLTGDLATRDDAGFYTLVGRDDEVVNVAGHRLAPAELEAVATDVPGVIDAIATGVPDAVRGHALVLFVIAADGAASGLCRRVHEQVRCRLGAFAAPKAVVLTSLLPRTRSGKPLRRLLRALVVGDDPGDCSTLADPAALDALRAAWSASAADRGQAASTTINPAAD